MLLDFDDDKLISVDELAWCHQAQAFTKANVDPDLYPHMASLSHSELGYEHVFAVMFLLKNRQYWDLYVFFNKSIAMNLLYLFFLRISYNKSSFHNAIWHDKIFKTAQQWQISYGCHEENHGLNLQCWILFFS